MSLINYFAGRLAIKTIYPPFTLLHPIADEVSGVRPFEFSRRFFALRRQATVCFPFLAGTVEGGGKQPPSRGSALL